MVVISVLIRFFLIFLFAVKDVATAQHTIFRQWRGESICDRLLRKMERGRRRGVQCSTKYGRFSSSSSSLCPSSFCKRFCEDEKREKCDATCSVAIKKTIVLFQPTRRSDATGWRCWRHVVSGGFEKSYRWAKVAAIFFLIRSVRFDECQIRRHCRLVPCVLALFLLVHF